MSSHRSKFRKPGVHPSETLISQAPKPAPPEVKEVLNSPGRSLDDSARTTMESRFGHDFSQVRVHSDTKASESAQEVNALAYTVGKDVVFGAGRYAPGTVAGRRLLAHELTHVVQQQRGSSGSEAEEFADVAAERIICGEAVPPEMIGSASPGLYAQNDEDVRPRSATRTDPPLRLDWETLSQFGLSPWVSPTGQPGALRLTDPSLRVPSPMSPSLGPSSLTPPSLTMPGQIPPAILPSGGQPGLRPLWLTPPRSTTPASAGAPEAPSRLPVISSGQFSLGLRLSFPEVETSNISGASPSALQESLRRAEIISQTLSGRIPTGWEAVDKAQLAGAIWGIFSTKIAPDLASRISSGLSTRSGPGRASYELDLVLLSDFSGGGISFTVRHP